MTKPRKGKYFNQMTKISQPHQDKQASARLDKASNNED
jgi:hypothetical protein